MNASLRNTVRVVVVLVITVLAIFGLVDSADACMESADLCGTETYVDPHATAVPAEVQVSSPEEFCANNTDPLYSEHCSAITQVSTNVDNSASSQQPASIDWLEVAKDNWFIIYILLTVLSVLWMMVSDPRR